MIVFLTGITGLVGCHTAMRLLAGGHSVVALARAKTGVPAGQRVRRVLESSPEYGARFNLAGLHVVEGDMLRPGCGMAAQVRSALAHQVDVAIHCAGDVAFGLGLAAGYERANVDGAGHVGELVRDIGCPRLVHVSTAYVARNARRDQPAPGPSQEGNVPSREGTGVGCVRGAAFRTPYEESKFRGEVCLREAAGRAGFELRIVRPSIVTGDTVHGFTPTYHGIYPFLKYAVEHAHELKRVSPADGLPPGFVPEARINLVPADVVAAVLCEAACNPALKDREFNVINSEPWIARELGAIVAGHAGIGAEVFTRTGTAAAPLSAAALSAVEMLQDAYAPYFDVDLDADTASTDRLMASRGIARVRNTPAWIAALLAWGIRHGWKELA